MAFQQTAYNNYDPRPMPVGTDLMARGGGNYSDSGIADDFIPEISQENDLPFLGRCNFPNSRRGLPVYAVAGAPFRPHLRRAARYGRLRLPAHRGQRAEPSARFRDRPKARRPVP